MHSSSGCGRKLIASGARGENAVKGNIVTLAFLRNLLADESLLVDKDGRRVAAVINEIDPALFDVLPEVLPKGVGTLHFVDYTARRVAANRDLLRAVPAAKIKSDLIFTLADDNVGVLPQSSLGSIETLATELRRLGWNGFSTRYWLPAELDPTVYYLSCASFDPTMTARRAHDELFVALTGKQSAADRLWLAFGHMEKATELIDANDLGFAFPVEGMLMKHYRAEPIPDWWNQLNAHYTEVSNEFYRAFSACDPRPQIALLLCQAERIRALLFGSGQSGAAGGHRQRPGEESGNRHPARDGRRSHVQRHRSPGSRCCRSKRPRPGGCPGTVRVSSPGGGVRTSERTSGVSEVPEPVVYLNGRMVPASAAHLAIYDAGIVLGATVTEMVRTFHNKLYRLEEHLVRLARALKYVRFDIGISMDQMADVARKLVEHNAAVAHPEDELGLIIFVTAGEYATYAGGAAGGARTTPTVCAHTFPLPFELWAKYLTTGLHLVTPSVRHVPPQCIDPKMKYRSRMHYYLADQEARMVDPQAAALLLDLDGNVTETSGANFLIVENGTIVSPTLRNILPGISRQTVIELAAELGIGFVERDIQTFNAVNADEAFTVSTPYCVMPVTRINNTPIADGKPGPIVARLRSLEQKSGPRYRGANPADRKTAVAKCGLSRHG